MTYDWKIGEKTKQWVDDESRDDVCHAEVEGQPSTSRLSRDNEWRGMGYSYIGYLYELIPELTPILNPYLNGHGSCRAISIRKSHPRKIYNLLNKYNINIEEQDRKFVEWMLFWMVWAQKHCENPVILVN